MLNAGALHKFRETAAHDYYARAHSELVWPFWWSQPECKGAPLVSYKDADVTRPVKCFRTEPEACNIRDLTVLPSLSLLLRPLPPRERGM